MADFPNVTWGSMNTKNQISNVTLSITTSVVTMVAGPHTFTTWMSSVLPLACLVKRLLDGVAQNKDALIHRWTVITAWSIRSNKPHQPWWVTHVETVSIIAVLPWLHDLLRASLCDMCHYGMCSETDRQRRICSEIILYMRDAYNHEHIDMIRSDLLVYRLLASKAKSVSKFLLFV